MPHDASIIEYHPTIKELPESERPRERLEHYGATALSAVELLAIILRTGARDENVIRLAQRLLAERNGLAGLARLPFNELVEIRGLGPAKAAQLKAAFELGRRLQIAAQRAADGQVPGRCCEPAMIEMGLLEQEHLRTIILDSKNQLLKGTQSTSAR